MEDNERSKRPEFAYSVRQYGRVAQLGFLKFHSDGGHDHWYAYVETLGMDGVE